MDEVTRINEMCYEEGREWEYCRVKGKTLKKKHLKATRKRNHEGDARLGRCVAKIEENPKRNH